MAPKSGSRRRKQAHQTNTMNTYVRKAAFVEDGENGEEPNLDDQQDRSEEEAEQEEEEEERSPGESREEVSPTLLQADAEVQPAEAPVEETPKADQEGQSSEEREKPTSEVSQEVQPSAADVKATSAASREGQEEPTSSAGKTVQPPSLQQMESFVTCAQPSQQYTLEATLLEGSQNSETRVSLGDQLGSLQTAVSKPGVLQRHEKTEPLQREARRARNDAALICPTCCGSLDLVKAQVRAKGSATFSCQHCKGTQGMINKHLGDFFASGDCQLTSEGAIKFFAEARAVHEAEEKAGQRRQWSKVRELLVTHIASSLERRFEAQYGGEYLPLSVYAQKGFNTEDIEKNCKDTRLCSVLGLCYKVSILGSKSSMIFSEVEKKLANREELRRKRKHDKIEDSTKAKQQPEQLQEQPQQQQEEEGPELAGSALADGAETVSSESSSDSSSDSSSGGKKKKKKKGKSSKKKKGSKKEKRRLLEKEQKERAKQRAQDEKAEKKAADQKEKEERREQQKRAAQEQKQAAQELRRVKIDNAAVNTAAMKSIAAVGSLVKELGALLKHPKASLVPDIISNDAADQADCLRSMANEADQLIKAFKKSSETGKPMPKLSFTLEDAIEKTKAAAKTLKEFKGLIASWLLFVCVQIVSTRTQTHTEQTKKYCKWLLKGTCFVFMHGPTVFGGLPICCIFWRLQI